jgi:hypothetical protein
MGQSLLGGIYSLAAALAAQDAAAAFLEPAEAALAQAGEDGQRAVYFDLLGLGMVTYRDSAALYIHNAPLALCVLLPLSSVTAVRQRARARAHVRSAPAALCVCM